MKVKPMPQWAAQSLSQDTKSYGKAKSSRKRKNALKLEKIRQQKADKRSRYADN